MEVVWNELVSALTNGQPTQLPLALVAIVVTAGLIWRLNGRAWAYVYVALIPFLNWTFGRPQLVLGDPGSAADFGQAMEALGQAHMPVFDLSGWFGALGGPEAKVIFNPLTIATGMVFVIRDFVQREMGHRVLVLMALAIGWSFYYSWPVIAIASGIAFAISETVDWLLFTFTRYRLSTRILLSSALAAPIDTTVFLYGADLAVQQAQGEPAGTMFNVANWIFFILGKMVGAVVVSYMIRQREKVGEVDPAAA
jgi:hypothetical protein